MEGIHNRIRISMSSEQNFSKQSMTRCAGTFGAVTMLSRVLGLVRDILSAGLFGTSSAWDAFVIAFTIPNMFRMMLGEGALAGAFIPLFTKYLHEQGKGHAWRFTNRVISILSVVLVVIIIAGWALFALLFRLDISPRLHEVIILSAILLPYMFFICNVGLLMGVLNAFYHFFLPAFAPVMLNVVLIVIMLGLAHISLWSVRAKIIVVAFGVLLGGIIQFSSHFVMARKKGLKYRFMMSLSDEGVKKVWLLMLPAVIGLSINQINLVVDRFLAYIIGEGAASTLYYSNRLIQLPVGVFGVALATTSFPLLAHHVAKKQMGDFKSVLEHVLKMMIFIAVPATVGLMVLSVPIIRMIFERRQFDVASTAMTAQVLFFYSIGLVAYCCNKTIIRAFYSLQDTKTPVRIGLISLLLNVVLNLILMVPLKQSGLALSTSITAFVGFFLLLRSMREKIGGFITPDIFRTLRISLVSALVMAFASYGSLILFRSVTQSNTANNIITGIAPVCLGGAVYVFMAYVQKSSELYKLIRMLRPSAEETG